MRLLMQTGPAPKCKRTFPISKTPQNTRSLTRPRARTHTMYEYIMMPVDENIDWRLAGRPEMLTGNACHVGISARNHNIYRAGIL